MAGELTLDSQPGMGTEVTVRLRLPRMSPQPMPTMSPAPQASPAAARRILVVDDHGASRHVLIQQLHYLGHEAIGAANGQQALSAGRTAAGCGHYRLQHAGNGWLYAGPRHPT